MWDFLCIFVAGNPKLYTKYYYYGTETIDLIRNSYEIVKAKYSKKV